jgi:unsaturated chondroitin disaccharide hydrolase
MSASTNTFSASTDAPLAKPVGLDHAYALCIEKTRRNIKRLADDPKSGSFATDGDYFSFPEQFFDIGNWTSSFHTGMALLAYETTGDRYFLTQSNRLGDWYRDKITIHAMDTMHDLGFLYSLYSVATYKLTGDRGHRSVGLKAAEELSKRFIARGGYIQAWGRMDDLKTDYAGLAIIDCMMNLPLLIWAAAETGNRYFREIAVRHADTTLANFIRADGSVYHAFRYDVTTGTPARGDNYCGHDVETHWARGTSWAIYGFAMAYGYTKDVRYLEASKKIAHKYLGLIGGNMIPVWDFRLGDGMPRLPDSSAAAITACGFMELAKYDVAAKAGWEKAADATLAALCNETFLNTDVDTPGLLRLAQAGGMMIKAPSRYEAKNVYASWGDYYLMEVLARKLKGVKGYWQE